MPSSYTTNLGIELPADGELDGVWGDVVNENMDILDRAINGSVSLTLSGTSSTLTTSDGVLSNGQYKLLALGGSPSGTHTITILPNDAQKIYFVYNTTAQSVVFTQGSGGSVTIATGDSGIIYSNGAGVTAAVVNLTDHFAMSSAKITGGVITGITDLAVADGGTGASSASAARTNLGLGTVATQDAGAVAITGGVINATVVGGTTPAAGTFTTGAFGVGTAALPSVTITGDPNTGLFSPAADSIAISTGGSERMRVNSVGDLGIGTTAPSALGLSVAKGSGLSAGLLISNPANNWSVSCAASVNALTFIDNQFSAERMRISQSGGVSIGNTTDPGATNLSVTGTVSAGGDAVITGRVAAGTAVQSLAFAGITTTADDDGTFTTGTYTPTPVGGNMKRIINGGAFTLAAPSVAGDYTLVVQITNNATAGAITLSGFTRTTGNPFTTTNGHDFFVYITKCNGFTLANTVALQ